MSKADITTELLDQLGVQKKESSHILEITLAILKEALKNGDPVKIAGFGNFTVRQKKGRMGRNPKTGAKTRITPRKVVTFKPSAIFKNEVNGPNPPVDQPSLKKK